MKEVILPAIRRRGEPPYPPGTVIVLADGRPAFVFRSGRYVRIEASGNHAPITPEEPSASDSIERDGLTAPNREGRPRDMAPNRGAAA